MGRYIFVDAETGEPFDILHHRALL